MKQSSIFIVLCMVLICCPSLPLEAEQKEWTDPITGMEFVWIEGGCFQMGSPESEKGRDSDEGPLHEVCVDSFWMGKYEITQAQWQKIMGQNPSYFNNQKVGQDTSNHTVEQVSWDDVQEFIQKFNGQSEQTFRLPTETEWEYACRAGTSTPFSFGETISTDQANYDGDYIYGTGQKGIDRGQTTPVGSFPPNAFGLYDMHGNVWEWCQDIYNSDAYKDHQRQNPVNISGGSDRGLRGGSWNYDPMFLRSAGRGSVEPAFRYYNIGVRLVRTK